MAGKQEKTTAPYGSWKSPITSDLIVSGTISLGQIVLDGDALYWTEGRPSENGRNTLLKWTEEDDIEEMSPAGFNLRSRVHEYGGGAYTVNDEIIYFVNFVDQRLYIQYPYSEADPLTAAGPYRFADLQVDAANGRLICVREEHHSDREPTNTLVSLDLDGYDETGTILDEGADFYASPVINPDADKLAWLQWNHPNMPWDGTELWVADIEPDGTLSNKTLVAGGETESVFQPRWSPDGVLHFVSDQTNWWNLYRWENGRTVALYPMEAEFGLPQWVFGMSTYGFASPTTIICTYTQNGRWYLARLHTQTQTLTPIKVPFTEIDGIQVSEGVAAFLGASATEPPAVIRLELANDRYQILRKSTPISVDESYLSIPEAIEFPTENGLTAHAIYYPPKNGRFEAPAGEKPPLRVLSHGGPTGSTSTALNLGIQYWTSRGFAVLDVNYGGSTGYGRSYRERLNGVWGILDVQDCINGAKNLVEQGLVDQDRLTIRGGSAGGYTTLCALAYHDVFKAGASYYGISDIEALATDTHKFESRYLDKIIGPYPEAKDTYVARSPIHAIDQINCPIILFQGLDDKVVPPNQSERFYESVKDKGIPVAYVPFAGEGHGFRQAPNIKRALDGELYFYSRVFGFDLADPVDPIDIDNL